MAKLGGRRRSGTRKKRVFKKGVRRPNARTSNVQTPFLHSTQLKMNAPLPRKLNATFYYAEELTLDPGVSVTDVHVFSLNGMFDPDITGTGHQPRGFDQLMPLYDHYTVIAAHVEAVFCPVAGNPVRFGMFLRDTLTAITTWNDYIEQGSQKVYKVLSVRDTTNDRLILDVNIAKFLGVSKPLSASQLRGDVGNNPLEGAFVHFVGAGFSTGDVTNFPVQILITYTAILTEPKQPTQS